MDIKRYKKILEALFIDKDGEWVKYTDHLQIVKELEEKNESVENEILYTYEAGGLSENGFNEIMNLINNRQPKEQD